MLSIIGSFDKDRLFCAGSFSKLTTTYVCLSLLSEKYDLQKIIDDDDFLDRLCRNSQAKFILHLFQKKIKSKFSIRDLCSFYSGLPYTFDVSLDEIEKVEAGELFKHHCILDESTFLERCQHSITPIYTNKCKFHYSELAIIFLGYLIEQVYDTHFENLYDKYIVKKFNLNQSLFSRKMVPNVFCQDLSDKYDYPSVAILDHGYFCYSNGFFTTLNDMKILLENLFHDPIFNLMTDLKHARAASNTIMNGLTVEIRKVDDDLIYGYEGLSYSGCNIWAYSTKNNEAYLTFTDNEEEAYPIIYGQWNYVNFDKAPDHTQKIYKNFLKSYHEEQVSKEIPIDYQGNYHRVKVNEKSLKDIFVVGSNFIIIRNPEEIKYDVIWSNGFYHVKGKDGVPSEKVGFIQSHNNNFYMYHDGTLYVKV